MKNIFLILAITVIALSMMCVVSAGYLKAGSNLKEKDGKLIDTLHNNEVVGTVQKVGSADAAKNIVMSADSGAINKVASTSPTLVNQYDTNNGVYFEFARNGDVYLIFVDTAHMKNGMLGRVTDFCKAQGY